MSWYPKVKSSSTTTYTASITLEVESHESSSDAELTLARKLRTAAEDIERAVDKRQNVMAP